MDDEERLDFVLAIGEAVSNAVRHGAGEKFSVRVWSDDGAITVDVVDEGNGFPRPAFVPLDVKKGGYGMLIVHKLTDEVHLLNGGRRVRLVKRLPKIRALPYRVG